MALRMARFVALNLSMRPATRDRLRDLAEADQTSMSEAVRRLIDREHALRILGLPIVSAPVPDQRVAQPAPE